MQRPTGSDGPITEWIESTAPEDPIYNVKSVSQEKLGKVETTYLALEAPSGHVSASPFTSWSAKHISLKVEG